MKKKQDYYGKNIVTSKKSFIAYFFYIKKERALNIVLRTGKQYRYAGVPIKLMDAIMMAPNRSNNITCNIIHNKKFKAECIGIVPAADIEKVTQPANLTKWLAQ